MNFQKKVVGKSSSKGKIPVEALGCCANVHYPGQNDTFPTEPAKSCLSLRHLRSSQVKDPVIRRHPSRCDWVMWQLQAPDIVSVNLKLLSFAVVDPVESPERLHKLLELSKVGVSPPRCPSAVQPLECNADRLTRAGSAAVCHALWSSNVNREPVYVRLADIITRISTG